MLLRRPGGGLVELTLRATGLRFGEAPSRRVQGRALTTKTQGYFLEDLSVGMAAEITRVVSDADVRAFADLTGDHNPVHVDDAFAATTMFKERIAHGAFIASLLSAVMGMELPGPGAVFRSLNLNYRGPVRIGEEVTARAEIASIDIDRQLVTLDCVCMVRGRKVVRAQAAAWVARREQGAADA